MSKFKILHFADIQIEIRKNQQRAKEYTAALDMMIERLATKEYEYLVITGDVFEFPLPNEVERLMFVNFLIKAKQFVSEIVLIDGNHDLVQKNNTFLQTDGEYEIIPSPLETIVTSINDAKVRYFGESKYYRSIEQRNQIVWAVWAHKTKFDPYYTGSYSPHINDADYPLVKHKDDIVIDLYHDPISCALDFSNGIVHGAERHVGLDVFAGEICLAGDIHAPGVYESSSAKKFTYCSSLIIRDFGEGTYYDGLNLYQHGNDRHGYNDVTYDNGVWNINFVKFPPPVTYNTIRFTNKFSFSDNAIAELDVHERGEHKTLIRLIVETNHIKFGQCEPAIRSSLISKIPNCHIEVKWGKDILSSDQVEVSDISLDRGQLVSNEQIIDIAKDYIEKRVNKSKSIAKEDREEVIKDLNDLFVNELVNIDRTNSVKVFSLIDADISNFMVFGDNIHIDFDQPGENNTLTRISGTNGIGKTMIMRFVAWMITDQISWAQNQRNKKDNYLSYFNDSRLDNDTVDGKMTFFHNNTTYILKKQLTRNWMSGVEKDIEWWKNQIDGVPSLSMSLEATDGSLNLTTNEDVMEWLSNNIGSYYDLCRLMFVNYENLDDLINSPTASLNDQILYNLGLNFFDALSNRYDAVKIEKMQKLYKPDKSIAELQDMISNANTSLEENKKAVEDNIENLKVLVERKNTETTRLNETQSKILHVGFDKNQANQSIETYSQSIIDCNTRINGISADINKLLEAKETINATMVPRYEELKIVKDNNDKEQVRIESNNTNLKSQITIKQGEARIRVMEITKEYDDLIAAMTSNKELNNRLIAETKQSIELTNSETRATVSDVTNFCNKRISKLEYDITDSKRIISECDVKILETNESIKALRASDTCVTCKRPLDETHLVHINEEIAKLTMTGKLAENEKESQRLYVEEAEKQLVFERDTLKEEIAKIQSEHENKIKELNDKITDLITEITEIETQIETTKVSKSEIIKSDSVILSIAKEVNDYNASILSNTNKLNELIEDAKKIALDVIKVKESIDKIPKIDSSIHDYKVEIVHQNSLIEQYNSKIADIQSKIPIIEENERLTIECTTIQSSIQSIETAIDEQKSVYHDLRETETRLNDTIVDCNTKIDMHVLYRRTDSSMRIYKQLLGKDGLVAAVFASIVGVINKRLNDLLDGVNFRLFFDNWGVLKMMDLTKSSKSVRSVVYTSGMEKTFLGLSLLFVLRDMNSSKQCSPLFIDELTGKLNDGELLTYDAVNYQQKFLDLLSKINKTAPILIVDHVIDDINEDCVIEVVPGKNGSTVEKFQKNRKQLSINTA